MANYYDFYTYAYLRLKDRTPYYIGKGQGNRAWAKHRKGISVPKDLSRILILKSGLSEEEAWRHEIYMVAVFGRKDLGTGILHNRTDGGEGASGAVRSEEFKRKVGDRVRNKPSPTRGTIGITNGEFFRRIKPCEDIPEGWEIGAPESFKQAVKENHHDVSGAKNPAYGKRRITNGVRERRIPRADPIPEGWWEGAAPSKISKVGNKPIEITSVEDNFGLIFPSCKEAAEFTGGSPTSLRRVANGGAKSYLGWKVRYI
jgi:hypothetical protein